MIELLDKVVPELMMLTLVGLVGTVAFFLVRGFMRLFAYKADPAPAAVPMSPSVRRLHEIHRMRSRNVRHLHSALGGAAVGAGFGTASDGFLDLDSAGSSPMAVPISGGDVDVSQVSGAHDVEGAIFRPETYSDGGEFSSGFDFGSDPGDSFSDGMGVDDGFSSFGDDWS